MDNMAEAKQPIKDSNIIASGKLDVGNGHKIYWVDWGNKNVTKPIFYLHGGPGSGFDRKDFDKFDPKKHRVVFHDQRGSGRSTPFASIEHNSTPDLISDITKLKHKLGFDKISLYGSSWGATLALLYAIEHSEDIDKMLVGSIFLARDQDTDFFLRGRVASHFPEAWDRFAGMVPEEHRDSVSSYYKKMMFGKRASERKKFAREWMVFESSLLNLDNQPGHKAEQSLDDFAAESLAYLEAHYLLNGCFIEENYILNNARKLRNIQTVIVQGRYDFICMPSAAYDLHHALPSSTLHIVMSGHSSGDTVMREVAKAYTTMLWSI